MHRGRGSLGGAFAGPLALFTCLTLPATAAAQDTAPLQPGGHAYAVQLLDDLGCGNCHDGVDVESDIRSVAPDLSDVGRRLSPDFVLGFVQYPVRVRDFIGAARMPNFRLDEEEALALTLFLSRQVAAGGAVPPAADAESFERAKAAHPDVDARQGEGIFYALNCGACHTLPTVPQWEEKSAPDLSGLGKRVTPEWLASFLRAPEVVRPFGYRPGSGGRHPDFALTDEEADALASYFLGSQGAAPPNPPETAPLHPFSMRKAETLIREKYACLGCHRLGDEGGRIGPDLSSVGDRLQSAYIERMVRDPQAVVPGSVMPRILMPDTTRALIVHYLAQQRLPRDSARYPSLIENEPYPQRGPEGVGATYVKYCAACHGTAGAGDGFNAPSLPVPPTVHADSAYMSTRPDDTLFDGTYAGGYILGRSHRMPPWGFTLEREQIRDLVRYMRALCRCEPPAWSRRPGASPPG